MLEGFPPDRLAAVTKARKRAVCSLTSIGSSQWVGPKKTRRVAQHNRFFALIGLCRSRLARAIGEVRDRGALRDEFARLRNTGRLDRVLDEVLLDPAQLSILIENNPGAARRMTAMLRHLRIEARPEGLNSADVRSIQTCLLCAARGKCERSLNLEGSRDPSQDCPNSEAFRDLV
jgi:hypothetical protein